MSRNSAFRDTFDNPNNFLFTLLIASVLDLKVLSASVTENSSFLSELSSLLTQQTLPSCFRNCKKWPKTYFICLTHYFKLIVSTTPYLHVCCWLHFHLQFQKERHVLRKATPAIYQLFSQPDTLQKENVWIWACHNTGHLTVCSSQIDGYINQIQKCQM